ncbi:MAG: DMT family transporter [Planctomycetes bacterium]|nr:DMT family transporter [Planctomycetota bacterium]
MNLALARSCLFVIVVWGFWGFFNKLAAQTLQARPAVVWSCIFTTLVNVLILGWLLRSGVTIRWERGVALAGMGALTAGVAFVVWMSTLERADACRVIPLTALYPAVTLLLMVATGRERLRPINLLGVLLALVAGALICYQPAAEAVDPAPKVDASSGGY